MRSVLPVAFLLVVSSIPALALDTGNATTIERGRYLVQITGCNDCHTSGYTNAGGKVVESEWLKGDSLGYSGPWGTTYATNLRLRLGDMDKATWQEFARSLATRPPMPYWALNKMSEDDLDAIWAFTRSLGKAGDLAPAALPPDIEPALPYFKLHLPPAPAK